MQTHYRTNILNDSCLLHSKWLQVFITKSNLQMTACSELDALLNELIKEAHAKQVSSITISIPVGWSDFSKLLLQNKWQKSLTDFSLINTKRQTSTELPKDLQIATTAPELYALMPLLMEQAKYHSELFPNYYRSPSEIDLRAYEQTLLEDFLNPSAVFACAYTAKTLVGYLQAENTKDSIHVFELIISVQHRGSGIGSQLLSSFLNLPEVQGKTVVLETWFNQRARAFYESVGFTAKNQEFFTTV